MAWLLLFREKKEKVVKQAHARQEFQSISSEALRVLVFPLKRPLPHSLPQCLRGTRGIHTPVESRSSSHPDIIRNMVDLGGYVIVLTEQKNGKIKLYGKTIIIFADMMFLRQKMTDCFLSLRLYNNIMLQDHLQIVQTVMKSSR